MTRSVQAQSFRNPDLSYWSLISARLYELRKLTCKAPFSDAVRQHRAVLSALSEDVYAQIEPLEIPEDAESWNETLDNPPRNPETLRTSVDACAVVCAKSGRLPMLRLRPVCASGFRFLFPEVLAPSIAI
eukprot:6400795-Pyramimonas_sp.AAC.1